MRYFIDTRTVRKLAWNPPKHLDYDSGDVLIYALADPRDETVRYVGKTVDRASRLEQHRDPEACRNRAMRQWLRDLKAARLEPKMMTLSIVIRRYWGAAERSWIAYFDMRGWRLYNLLPGGHKSWKWGKKKGRLADIEKRRRKLERIDRKKRRRQKHEQDRRERINFRTYLADFEKACRLAVTRPIPRRRPESSAEDAPPRSDSALRT